MNMQKIEENLSKITIPNDFDINFVYDLLTAYGKPKSSITRLKSGTYNLSKRSDEVYWKKNLLFKYLRYEDLHSAIDTICKDKETLRHDPRFIIVTDFEQLLAIDTKTQETLDIKIHELPRHLTFFLPWAGMEKATVKTENLADIKAATRMARLYDEIRKENDSLETEFIHSLNVFFSRLLFCFFAEDTDVFEKGQFTNSIASYTQSDGSDLNEYLDKLFEALDAEGKSDYPSHFKSFPYVNGGLFGKKISSPKFNSQARRILLECAELNWSQINPDIFGSMIQAVVHPGQRAGLGMHYTSVVNIMKVIEPLFLENLSEEFKKQANDKQKLEKLLRRIYKIKVFDPACGSGNFLIIAYKELRRLEHKIIQRILELDNTQMVLFRLSGIKLENFYGIEIDDFAHEVAILSLWLAKHQMNIAFKELFGIEISLIPLKDTGNITNGNATSLEWKDVCTNNKHEEIYLIGNPPYLGSSMQHDEQKAELAEACKGFSNYKNLDYIAIWFIKAAEYICGSQARSAFVSTNSICQGEQVALLWPHIFSKGLEIIFAHTSFKWTNNAKHNAGVTCVIIGLSSISNQPKRLYIGELSKTVSNINAYLAEGSNIVVPRRSKQISGLPEMIYGNKPTDNGYLILSKLEKEELLSRSPEVRKFIRRYMGAEELLRSQERYCLWIEDSELDTAMQIPEIAKRLASVREYRSRSRAGSTSDYADFPNRFKQRTYQEMDAIIVPSVTSERREYLTVDFVKSDTVISNRGFAIYGAGMQVFGILSSKMHNAWVHAVAGRLETRINYSSTICYNNFPVPNLTEKQKDMIVSHGIEIVTARENHSEKTLSEMYDPDNMPIDLRRAHSDLDEVVDRCYISRPFNNDEERLAHLFKLYEEMAKKEKEASHA